MEQDIQRALLMAKESATTGFGQFCLGCASCLSKTAVLFISEAVLQLRSVSWVGMRCAQLCARSQILCSHRRQRHSSGTLLQAFRSSSRHCLTRLSFSFTWLKCLKRDAELFVMLRKQFDGIPWLRQLGTRHQVGCFSVCNYYRLTPTARLTPPFPLLLSLLPSPPDPILLRPTTLWPPNDIRRPAGPLNNSR